MARDYTHALVRDHAANCEVTLVGSPLLAVIAERIMRGEAVEEAEIAREIAPCFVEREGRRTDQIVLACTHFPLIVDRLERLSPWPVGFVDPAPAIARRLDALIGAARPGASPATKGRRSLPAARRRRRRCKRPCVAIGFTFTPDRDDRLRLRPDRLASTNTILLKTILTMVKPLAAFCGVSLS